MTERLHFLSYLVCHILVHFNLMIVFSYVLSFCIHWTGFLVLGLFGGVYGAYFSKWNFWWCWFIFLSNFFAFNYHESWMFFIFVSIARRVRSKTFLNRWPVLEVVLVTALTVSLSLSNRMLKTGGTELVYEML